MSRPEWIVRTVTTHSKAVLVVLLLVTVLVGAGVGALEDDSSLEQFESDSPEAEAAEYVEDNFTVEDAENTTTVQVIVRGDGDGENVLTRESLIRSLEFQEEVRETDSINATLVDEDAITGVENVVATTLVREAQAADLEERGEQLQTRSEELNETAEDLEERGAELEERSQELEETSGDLEDALDEIVALQTQYTTATLEYEEGEMSQAEYAVVTATLESEMAEVTAAATADLEPDQATQFEETVADLRDVQDDIGRLEAAGDADEERLAQLREQRDGLFEQGTTGVLAAEFEQLEDDSEQLEEDREELEAAFEQVEDDSEALEEDQRELEEAGSPTLDEQREALEDAEEGTFEETLGDVLSDDDGESFALGLMPTDYEPGSTEADARMLFITQATDGEAAPEMGAMDGAVTDAQLDLRELANDQDEEYAVFGFGVISDEIDRSMGDSLAIVGPLALLFVVAALLIAYRDPLDIALGVVGIVAVLVWTFGFMGWAGIAFNQMFVAVPVLLIGLSIDYAIHVFMRHREQRGTSRTAEPRTGSNMTREQRGTSRTAEPRTGSNMTREQRGAEGIGRNVRGSMAVALGGVGVALVWVTATTAIGFLANLVSPIGPIQEFGVVSAVGILSALIVFGAMIPAAKVEIDSALEARGFDRQKRAFGTGDSRFSDVLKTGAVAARRAPLVVLLVVLLVSAGGTYGASEVDTSFDEENFLADSPPAWTESLPGPFEPGEYAAKADLQYVNEHFQREDSQARLLLEGDVTDDRTLERIATAEDEAADSDVAYQLPTGEADVTSPLSVMEETAAENESFNESFVAADTTGDEVPDQDLEALYDELFEVNPDASEVIYQNAHGEYEAVQVVVAIQGDADGGETTDEMWAIAESLESGGPWTATATGDPIVNYVVEQDLLDTVLQSLLITLIVVFTFLSIAYWATGSSASLGAVTLLPVAFAVSWILGTMYLIGMPFNVLTGMITSLTIGLGVAYSIHVSSRYTLELERQGNVWDALDTTVTGTGGALLGSAATTVGGFGTLALAILPVLQQFGIITGLTIIYAFLASVIVLPTLLVLWTRYLGPDVSFEFGEAKTPTPTASDGGLEGGDEE
ncbi:efflux RND transporter permease subunit [Natrialbaceae archaeon A-gly3]